MKKKLNRRDFLGTVSVVGAGLAVGLPTIVRASGGAESFTGKRPYWARNAGRTSKTIASVLREPLPAEELSLFQSAEKLIISGPTFTYHINKVTGAINIIRVVREEQEVIAAPTRLSPGHCA